MIVVIADDFTGAAELAGIGLRFGLKVEIQLDRVSLTDADLLVIDTATRTMPLEAAVKTTREVAQQIRKLAPEWIYKKTDSVLRGHVIPELQALRESFGDRAVVFLPANPGLGRIISNGNYYVRGELLHSTTFATDPEYDLPIPLSTSAVLDLLGGLAKGGIQLAKKPTSFPGILVGEVSTATQLPPWAAHLGPQTIPAGAAEFFEAILRNRMGAPLSPRQENPYVDRKKVLLVCGSHSESSRKFIARYVQSGAAICRMPCHFDDAGALDGRCLPEWRAAVLQQYRTQPKVLVTAAETLPNGRSGKIRFIDLVSELVEAVLAATQIDELIIEGGSTSSSALRRLGWHRMTPLQELAPGVVRMKVPGERPHHLTVKPGSYDWPPPILEALA